MAGQVVGDHHPWLVAVAVDDATQEGLGRLLVAPLLHEDVQYDPFLVHCPPQPVLPTVDLQLHLVENATCPQLVLTGDAMPFYCLAGAVHAQRFLERVC
jgi:hypothetical protein